MLKSTTVAPLRFHLLNVARSSPRTSRNIPEAPRSSSKSYLTRSTTRRFDSKTSADAARVGGQEGQRVAGLENGVEAALEIEDAVVEDDLDVLGEELRLGIKHELIAAVGTAETRKHVSHRWPAVDGQGIIGPGPRPRA